MAVRDFRWDHGFVTDQTQYLEQRVRLQQELEQLTPVPDDELERAADILNNFTTYWGQTGDDRAAQERLVKMIVARVWVRGQQVVAISLRPNYHVTVGLKSEKPTELEVDLSDRNIVLNRERRASGNPVYKVLFVPPHLKANYNLTSQLCSDHHPTKTKLPRQLDSTRNASQYHGFLYDWNQHAIRLMPVTIGRFRATYSVMPYFVLE